MPSPSRPSSGRTMSASSMGKKSSLPFGVTRETGTFGCLFFVYLSVIPFLFVWCYHLFPTTVLSIIMVFALCSFIPLLFHTGKKALAEPLAQLLAASMLAATALVFLGSMYLYWAHIRPMRALILARDYDGVYPELPSVAFGDAAYVHFAGSTRVDTARSVSMHSLDAGLNTFCVAPIVSEAHTGRVQFWAVGVDCCDPGGRFQCDDVGQKGAESGWVMQNPTDPLFERVGKYIAPPITRRDLFFKAIRKAEHTLGLVASEDAVLVRWTKKSKNDLVEQEWLIVIVACIVNTALSVLMALFLTRIYSRIGELRALQQGNQEALAQQEGDKSARTAFSEVYENHVEEHVKLLCSIDHTRALPPPTVKDTLIMSIGLPYVVMMLCVCLTTYSGCYTNGHLVYAPFLTLVGIGILAELSTPGRVVTGLFLLLVSATGLYIGSINYNANMFHYCSIQHGRKYSKVPATAESELYRDAGIMTFADKAYLSQEHAVGFLYSGISYCAAPVLSHADDCASLLQNSTEDSPAIPPSFFQRTGRMHMSLDTDDEDVQDHSRSALASARPAAQCKHHKATRVEFWAIGTGCCKARKEFSCDGGKDASAHSGVLVRATGNEEPGGDRDQFLHAIWQAVAAYELPHVEHPALIRWGKDPQKLQNEWSSAALTMVILTAIVGFLILLVVGFGTFFYTRMVIKWQETERVVAKGRRDLPDVFLSP